MRALLAVLLLAATLPIPAALAADPYAVDAVVELDGPGKAVERHTFTYGGGSTRWTLLVPEGATFVRATDASGELEGSVSGGELRLTSRRSPFTVTYERATTAEGPLTRVSAQVASASDSPTTVRVALAPGWTIVGYRASGDLEMGADGALRDTGPQTVEFLLASGSLRDEGPDPRVSGQAARREAVVRASPTSASMDLTVVYDTDVYSRDWSLAMPDGATLRGVSTPWGPVPATVEAGAARFSLPYPAGYHLGARPFTVAMDLPAPVAHGGAFRKLDANVAAAPQDDVSLRFVLSDGAILTGVHASARATVDGGDVAVTGPLAATMAFLPPAPAGAVRFTQGPFVVQVPSTLDVAARAVARNASEVLPWAAGFAGGADVTRPFYVAYTREPIFDWEAGFYSPGLNTISIRADTLDNSSDGRARLEAVSVLIHETTHGLLDRLVDGGPSDLSFFQEGLSRLAETRVELAFPDEVIRCARTAQGESCVRHSARPEAGALQAFHASGDAFDAAWTTKEAPASQRAFLYDYSGLAFHAYERASPPGALERALAEIAATPGGEEPASAATWLQDALLLHSPGVSRAALLYPGREAAALPLPQFRACMGPLVAPGFPFDPEPEMPDAGCPEPAPPTQAERDALTRPATPTDPVPVVTTAPPPKATPPPTRTPPGTDTTGGQTPGGVVEAPVAVPAGWAPLAALAVGLAVAFRARRR